MVQGKIYFGLIALGIGVAFILRPDVSWTIQRFVIGGDLAERETALTLQKLALESRIAELSQLEASIPPDAVTANVYSRYPFNFKNELLISVGYRQGVDVGQAVTVPVSGDATGTKPVFVGRVTEAFADSALVTTIFDLEFQIAVRFGNAGTDALLVGGGAPRLTLIAKQATVSRQTPVYTAAPDLPYGLPIGWTGEANVSHDQLFQEAAVVLPYDLGELRQVFVHKNVAERIP